MPTVTNDHRERVIEQLQAGFAGDVYEVDELERRLTLAQSVESPAALDALVADLVDIGATAPATSTTALVETRRLRVVFGSTDRRGAWDLPRRLAARVTCGQLVLDLREAQIAPGTSEIHVDVTLGNVEIVVPPGVAVDVDASSTLGHVEDHSERGRAARVVRIVGRVVLGNLEVTTLRRGETAGDGRRRRRWERRARRHAMRDACGRRWPPPPYEG